MTRSSTCFGKWIKTELWLYWKEFWTPIKSSTSNRWDWIGTHHRILLLTKKHCRVTSWLWIMCLQSFCMVKIQFIVVDQWILDTKIRFCFMWIFVVTDGKSVESRSVGQILSAQTIFQDSESLDSNLQANTNYMKVLKHILTRISDKSGFLAEKRLKELLKGYTDDQKNIVRLDNVFAVSCFIYLCFDRKCIFQSWKARQWNPWF